MKKIFILLLLCSQVFGQTNIAVPSYSSGTPVNPATGYIKFYLNGVSQTLTVGHGANGVCFYGNNMFVAYDDGSGTGNGIFWYKNVSFSTGTFASDSPVILVNNQQTFQVVADESGNIYSANFDGTITKFMPTSPNVYTSANRSTKRFFNSGNYVLGGLMIYKSSATNSILWAVSYNQNTAAACILVDWANTVSTTTPSSVENFVKPISISGNLLQKPEGIHLDNLGNIWIGNNDNNYVLRINSSAVNLIKGELNNFDFTPQNLTSGTDVNDFAISGATQLGGMVYDNLYSNRMYVNNQLSNNTTNQYSFLPTNGTPAFNSTAFSQIYPGNGQAAIIPCALLPTPSNPTAAGTTINSGQTATLTASACAADQTYLWKSGAATVGTSAAYTTPNLTTTTSYTAHCVRGGTCQSSGLAVTVTISGGCSTPANPSSASATPYDAMAGSTLSASGCASGTTYRWKQGATVVANSGMTIVFPSSTTTYTAHCVSGACESTGSPVTVTVTPPAGGVSSNVSISVVTPITGGGTRTDTRTFRIHLPSASPTCNLPVVMAFHGDGGSGAGMETSTQFSPLADAQNFIAVYPDKLSGQSYFSYRIDAPAYLNGQIDQTFMQAIIDYMYVNYGINKNRVYATGHSSGAAFVYFLTAKLPNSFAAFAPVAGFPQDYSAAGNVWTGAIANAGTPKLPIMHVHGTADAVGGTEFTGTNLPSSPYPSTPTNNNTNPYIWPMFPLSDKSCANGSANYTAAYFQAGNTTVDKLTMCAGGGTNKEVSMMIVRGMGHAWPTSALTGGIDGTLAIWNFLKDYQLTAYPAPSPSISPASVTIASGASTTLTASGCGTLGFLWSSGQTTSAVSVSPTATTNYTVMCKSTISSCQVGTTSAAATVTVGSGGGGTHTIISCSQLTPSPTTFRVGISSSNSIKVFVNVTAAATITLNAVGSNFTGTVTQTFSTPDASAFIWLPINYDGGGLAGNRTITVSSTLLSAGTCTKVVSVLNQPIFSFGNCANGTISGNFYAGVASTGNVVVPITVNQAGPATISISGFSGSSFTGSLSTNLTMGQTSITIPYTYDGTGMTGSGDQIVISSADATSAMGSLIGYCYGPMVTFTTAPPASPCPNDVIVSAATYPSYTANQIVGAVNTITTNTPPNIIISTSNSNKLTYRAGKSVTLSPGFKVDNGAVFNAKIGGCVSTTATMKVTGRHLYDADGQQIIFRGVNYSVMDDWDFPASDKITEIEKSGANAVRLQWYKTDAGRPTYTNTDLDNLLTKCKTNKMVPILMLGDLTCVADANAVNTQLIPWWTDPARVAILNNHKKYLIINLANEVGQYRGFSAPYYTISINNWKNAYKTAITSIRNANLKMPIMIDAPDCGTDMKAIVDAGQEIINHDPEHNIIFSVHAYWAAYDGSTDLTNAINANLPIVFGEVANKQDEYVNGATVYGYYNLDGTSDAPNTAHSNASFQYQNLLTTLKNQSIGWLAWTWVRDQCTFRNMTNNDNLNPATFGKYNTLTTYGNNIVNNAVYGIKNTAVRSNAF